MPIIFNMKIASTHRFAGTHDIYKGNAIGQVHVSVEGIIERDQFVFQSVQDHNVPIAMILAEDYTEKHAPITAQSIANIATTFYPNKYNKRT